MTSHIKVWQIGENSLTRLETTPEQEGLKETRDLESWLASNPSIISSNIAIIGRQVPTSSGPMDLLGIDENGNLLVVEIKRGQMPREALAQAIDYAAAIANFEVDTVNEICQNYCNKTLEDIFNETFEEVDIENVTINNIQRILIVGFNAEPSLVRMVEWLANTYDLSVNLVNLKYVKTTTGEQLILRRAVLSDEEESEKIQKRKWKIPMSDAPGEYEDEELIVKLKEYCSINRLSNRLIRDIILKRGVSGATTTRSQIVEIARNEKLSESEGTLVRCPQFVSKQIGTRWNDFLRQVIVYEYSDSENSNGKDRYSVRPKYVELVKLVLC